MSVPAQPAATAVDHRTAAVASLPEATSQQEPLFTVTRGNPTPEELAVLVALFSAQPAAEEKSGGATPRKTPKAQSRRLRLGLRLRPGRGAWRRAQPER